jgi:hypothetical protein
MLHLTLVLLLGANPAVSPFAEIRVVDEATGRGIPLVELETTNNVLYVTDNNGRVAFHEPELAGREVYFTVRSHGYTMKKDGFGYTGVKLTPKAGKISDIALSRTNIAERWCRLTGEGLERDSRLLGYETTPVVNGRVVGQDSVQAAVFNGKVYWFWGDTQRIDYPLGLFRMAGATTPVPDEKTDVSHGIAFDYFTDPKSQFARAMIPYAKKPEGVVWVFALAMVPDKSGKQHLLAHYSRRKGLTEELEHGLCDYDLTRNEFVPVKELLLKETWRKPTGHPIEYTEQGTKYLLYGSPNPNVRTTPTYEGVLETTNYEAYTCLKPDGSVETDKQGVPVWRWQKELPPLGSKEELALVKTGKIAAKHARYCPTGEGKQIELHSGSVRWNAHRKSWILVSGQLGGNASLLGEVWFAEADSPTGPFSTATKIITHDKQTFYNVVHHPFLDSGHHIYLEGTYTNDFSGNPHRTPRYNYNQVLYRLDLDDKRLRK